jgi:hypothetical protein
MQEIADKTKSHNLRTDQGLRTEEMTAVLHTTPSTPGQALHSNKQIEQDHEHEHEPPSRSNSGTRPTNRSRASSNDSAYSNRSTRSNASTESNPSQMKEIQKHSSFSRSANKDKITSTIPSIYRTKSPSAQAALRRHFFTPGEKCDELES